MSYDEKRALTRAYLRGYEDALRVGLDAAREVQDRRLTAFLAHETFGDDETRRRVEGALRVER